MKLSCRLVDEPHYAFDSVDNHRKYKRELVLDLNSSSVHGLIVGDAPSVVVGAGGGLSGVHDHSLILVENKALFAVGDTACCWDLLAETMRWHRRVDEATCFGLYRIPDSTDLISHGEISIARLNLSGEVLWSQSGADIFSGLVHVDSRRVTARDFDDRRYIWDIVTGMPA